MKLALVKTYFLATFVFVNTPIANSQTQLDNYVLVGSIQIKKLESNEGIAVIKEKHTQKNITLLVGDSLPSAPEIQLIEINKNHLVFSANDEHIYLKEYIRPPRNLDTQISQQIELDTPKAEEQLKEFKESNRKILESSIKAVESFDEEQLRLLEALNEPTH